MKFDDLLETLDRGDVAPVRWRDWERFRDRFRQSSSHDTGSHGKIRVGRMAGRVVAVERADDRLRAVRAFDDRSEAKAFVEDRLAQYDRFWDG